MTERRLLTGIQAVDLTRWIAGPYLTRLLADLGARVIKVEPPAGDLARRLPQSLGPQDSGLFQQLNAGKQSVCLDLERRRDRRHLRGLVVPVAHPVLGEIGVTNSPYRFSGYRTGVGGLPPDLGQHNQQVLSKTLGYPARAIAQLGKAGAVFSPAASTK